MIDTPSATHPAKARPTLFQAAGFGDYVVVIDDIDDERLFERTRAFVAALPELIEPFRAVEAQPARARGGEELFARTAEHVTCGGPRSPR
jgi:hypothetical protein